MVKEYTRTYRLYTPEYFEEQARLFAQFNAIKKQHEEYLREVKDVIMDDVRDAMKDRRLSVNACMTVNIPKTPGMMTAKKRRKKSKPKLINLDSPNTSIISTAAHDPELHIAGSLLPLAQQCSLLEAAATPTMTPNRTQPAYKGKRLRSLLEQHQNSVNLTPVRAGGRMTRGKAKILEESLTSSLCSVKSTTRATRNLLISADNTPVNTAECPRANSTMIEVLPSTPVAPFGANHSVIESTPLTGIKKARFLDQDEEIVVSSPIGPITTTGTPTANSKTETERDNAERGEWQLSTGKRKKSKTPTAEEIKDAASTPAHSSTPVSTHSKRLQTSTHQPSPAPVATPQQRLQISTHQPSPAPVATPRLPMLLSMSINGTPDKPATSGTMGRVQTPVIQNLAPVTHAPSPATLAPSPADCEITRTPVLNDYQAPPRTPRLPQMRVPVIESTLDEDNAEKAIEDKEEERAVLGGIMEEDEEEEEKPVLDGIMEEEEEENEEIKEGEMIDEQENEDEEIEIPPAEEQKIITSQSDKEIADKHNECEENVVLLDNNAESEENVLNGHEEDVQEEEKAEVSEEEKAEVSEEEKAELSEEGKAEVSEEEDVSMKSASDLDEPVEMEVVETAAVLEMDTAAVPKEELEMDANEGTVSEEHNTSTTSKEKVNVCEESKELFESAGSGDAEWEVEIAILPPVEEVVEGGVKPTRKTRSVKKEIALLEAKENSPVPQARSSRSNKLTKQAEVEEKRPVRQTRSSRNKKKKEEVHVPSDSEDEDFHTPQKEKKLSLPKQGTVKKLVTQYESPKKCGTPQHAAASHDVSKRDRETETESEEPAGSTDDSIHLKKRQKDNTGLPRNPPNLMTSVFSLVNKPVVVVKSAKELEEEKKAAALKRIEEKEMKSQQVLNKKKQKENEMRLKRIERDKRIRQVKLNKEEEAKNKKAELEKKMRLKDEASAKERELMSKREEEKRHKEFKKQEQAELRRREVEKARVLKKKKLQEDADERKQEASKRKQELDTQRVRELEKHRQEEEARQEEQKRVETEEREKRVKAEEARRRAEEEERKRRKLEEDEKKKKTPIRTTPSRKLNTTGTIGTLICADTPQRPPRVKQSKIPTKTKIEKPGTTLQKAEKTQNKNEESVQKETVFEVKQAKITTTEQYIDTIKGKELEEESKTEQPGSGTNSSLFTPLVQKQDETAESPSSATTSRIQSYMKSKLQSLGQSKAKGRLGSRLGAISEDLPPVAPVYNPRDNYRIDDMESGDDTDEESKPKRTVPAWACNKTGLAKTLEFQFRGENRYNTTDIFGPYQKTANLDELFGTKNKYTSRTSSAHWSAPPATGELDFSILTEDEITRANNIFLKYNNS